MALYEVKYDTWQNGKHYCEGDLCECEDGPHDWCEPVESKPKKPAKAAWSAKA